MSSLQPRVPLNADKIIAKPLHQSAGEQAKKYVDDFATTLVLQAKLFASLENAELVLRRHIDEAVKFILSQKTRDLTKEFVKIIGGALIGAFVPGLITALPTHDTTSILIYIGLGFVGMIMVFIGLVI